MDGLDIYLKVGGLVIAGVVWFARLESKVMFLDGKVSTLEKDHLEFKNKVYEQLTMIKESLAKIEGFLQAKKGD